MAHQKIPKVKWHILVAATPEVLARQLEDIYNDHSYHPSLLTPPRAQEGVGWTATVISEECLHQVGEPVPTKGFNMPAGEA